MDNKVVCVVGPTACGKTKMGVALAQRFGGEVVSVDSMQIYRGMTVGTAAPTAEEMEGVPHHMVAVADPAESWSVARYVREADACVQDILRRGKRPVLVGGTGLYLDALVRGQDFAAGSQGGEIRRELQEKLAKDGAEALLEAPRSPGPQPAARRGCTCGTKSASSGRWRSITRRGRPSGRTTEKAGRYRPGTTRRTSAWLSGTGRI